ncbi:GEVED domain-containing protein [Phaeodactylibacter xiamenensis]|uniref:GEVED domain-containing protein n=2 Tax=Phaeodactylibacter xiamenensis TaxID=1524460 RepID=UPI003CCC3445
MSTLYGQSCNCTEYIYLNDTDLEFIHKFAVDETSGSVTEIGAPWFEGLAQSPQFTDPHGIAQDLNGNLYIATSSQGDIYQFDPFGNITLSPWLNNSSGTFDAGTALRTVNYGFKDNVLYIHNNQHRYVYAIDLCTGSSLGRMELYPGSDAVSGSGPVVWGFYVDNNNWYAVQRSNPGSVYTGPLDLSFYTTGFGTPAHSGTLLFNLSEPATGSSDGDENGMGITRDAAGNFYVIERQTISGTHDQPVLVKYSPTGAVLGTVTAPADPLVGNTMNGVPGFSGARGVTYSAASDRVYVSSKVNCISVFETDLTELSALNYGNPMNGRPKAIGVVTECCATPATQNINNTICYDGVNNETIFLQEVLDCEGIIAEGTWAETADANGVFDYESCDNSITVTGAGCATYTLTSNGTGTNNQCGAFNVTVEICTTDPPQSGTPTTSAGTCQAVNVPNNDATVTIPMIVNSDIVGVSNPGATGGYDGPKYNSDATSNPQLFAVSGGSVTITGLQHNQTYVIRLFNMGNGCREDVTVTTATIDCSCAVAAAPSANTPCVGDALNLMANPSGAASYTFNWSGPNGFTSTDENPIINMATVAAAGSYSVTVTDASAVTCSAIETVSVTINALPTVTLNDPADVCIDGSDMNFTATPMGGTFSTTAPAGFTPNNAAGTAVLDVSAAGAGTYDVTYTFTDGNGCEASQTVSVEVFALPTVTLNDPADVCIDGSDMNFTATPMGGTFSTTASAGFTPNNAAGTAVLDVSAAGVGTYDVTYTFTDGNGCEASQTVSVEVFALPTYTAVGTNPTVCTGTDGFVTISGLQASTMYILNYEDDGTAVGPTNVTSNASGEVVIMNLNAGNYTNIILEDPNGCSGAAASASLSDPAAPTVTLNDPADACIDGTDMSFTGSPAPVGGATGTFSSNAPAGFTDNGDGTASLDVSAAGAGVYTITYSYTDASGCAANQMVSVEVFALPTVTLNDPADVCIDGSDMNFTATPMGGTFSTTAPAGFTPNNAAGTAVLDVSAAGAGTYDVTYTFTDGNGCEASQTVSVEVFALPTVTLNDPADVCIDGSDMNFTATPMGGTFSTTAPSGFTPNNAAGTAVLDVSAAGAGTYDVTYTFTDGNGCEASQTVSVEIFALPTVTLNDPADVCIDGSDMNFTATPMGGTFSTTASAGFTPNNAAGTAVLDVSAAGVGTYDVTYTFTDGNGCEASQTVSVEVFALPTVTLNDPADVCIDGSDMNFTATPMGGTFSTTAPAGFTPNNAAGTAVLDVSAAGAGTYDVTYTFTDGNGCEASQTVSVEIFALPTYTAVGTNPTVCTGTNGFVTISGLQASTMYILNYEDDGTAVGPTNVTSNASGEVVIMNLNAGNYTNIILEDPNGCSGAAASASLSDPAAPTVTLNDPADACIDGTDMSFTGSPAPVGGATGTFSSNAPAGFTDNGDGTASLDVSASGAGVYTITYSYTDASGCAANQMVSVEVFALPTVTLNDPADVCIDGSDMNFTATPMGGTFSTTAPAGFTPNNAAGTAVLDVSAAGAGTYDVTYTYTDGNGCEASQTVSVEVFALPTVTLNDPADVCIDGSDMNFTATPMGGTFSTTAPSGFTPNNAAGTAVLDVSAAGAGTYDVTYTFTDGNGCEASQTVSVEVFALPTVTFSPIADLCLEDGRQTLGGGMPTGGEYSGTGVTDNGNGETFDFDPAIAGAGTITVTYTYTDGNGCTNSNTATITVYGVDYGDLQDPPYATTAASNGAGHCVADVPQIYIGSVVDTETDGQPTANADGDGADEDGFNPGSTTFELGETATFTVDVFNNTGSDAELYVWFDWNNDGTLDNATERYQPQSITVAGSNIMGSTFGSNGNVQTANFSVPVPSTAVLGINLGTRFRFSTDTDFLNFTATSTGLANDGEVEDYLIMIGGFDYGDLPDAGPGVGEGNYETTTASNGPSHMILTDPSGNVLLKIGADVDTEGDGQPGANADGDGLDEDGFDPTSVMFVRGESQDITIPVMNMTGGDAKLTLYVDWDNDGDFNEPEEMISVTVADGQTSAILSNVTPPSYAVLNDDLGFRLRLTTDAAMSPTGPAPDGEVEDYLITVMAFDYGDLADSGAGTGEQNYETSEANGGPSHKIVTNEDDMVTLKIGADVDADADGQPSADADGDGADEDGFDPTSVMFVRGESQDITIPVMNMTGGDAKLTLYVDWDNDGDFNEPEEMISVTVADGQTSAILSNVTPPAYAVLNDDLGFRLRLTTDAAMSPTGPAPDGEVEDYLITVMAFDYGDLADSGSGVGEGNYETSSANGGPSHKIVTNEDDMVTLKIGADVDADADGQPSADADGDGADEDGFDPTSVMFVRGESQDITIPVMNMTGVDAKLTLYVDWDNDGDFNEPEEMISVTVADGQTSAILSNVTPPAYAVLNDDLGFRLRLTTDAAMSPTGPAPDGEVEDYLITVMAFDYGDLADSGSGVGEGNYETSSANGGPSHKIVTNEDDMVTLKIGADVDADADGQPSADADGDGADEDGFDPTSVMFVRGESQDITIPVMNMTGVDAKLTLYVDWDNDGDFNEPEEMISVTVADGQTSAILSNVTPPSYAVLNDDLGFRLRLTTDAAMSPTGPAPDGEVEDYLITVMAFDYGDLADSGSGVGEGNYETSSANGGPSHKIVTNEDDMVTLKIGADVDADADGQPSADADGDGADEDGFDPASVMFVAGQMLDIDIPVMNMTGGDAKLTLYVDWDNDGDFSDPEEMFSVSVPDGTNGNVTLADILAPEDAALNTGLGFRLRLTTDAAMSPTGPAPDGEVEDYEIMVMGFDYGDLSDSGAGTNPGDYETQDGSNGPSHKIVTDPVTGDVTLKIGSTVDAEANGQQSANADGDGADEDGVSLPMFVTGMPVNVPVNVMNMTTEVAKLTMFVDWNNDGDFEDDNEMYSVDVPVGATLVEIEDVTPPLTATLTVPVGVRFRLSTDAVASMSPTGPAPDGEVEDYLTPSMGFDFGDLNDMAAGTNGDPNSPLTPADYQTTLADDGARHKILTNTVGVPVLKIGAELDDEANGQPNATAAGDDNSMSSGVADPDDEDGLDLNNLPLFILTQTTTLDIPVMNMSGEDATIAVYIDFNKDGVLDATTEKFTATVPDGATSAQVDVLVPVDAVVGQDLGLRIRLANNMAEVMSATGLANSGEVEDYMVQVVGFDYGDLPDTYTTSDPEAPKHIVDEDLLLGTCVDTEADGSPEAMAGLMQGGDDADAGLATFGTCGTAGDDEDGIVFVTPMIPGSEACIEVTAVNNKGVDAVLQMWVDWNGDGSFDAGEEVTFTSTNGNAIPDGGVNAELYCFDVPADAAFREGAAFVRFRLSEDGGLAPDSQTGVVPFGEIEDYKLPLGKVGNLVFEDYDFDGVQDANEPGIDGVTVGLTWLGPDNTLGTADDVIYADLTTGADDFDTGEYYFCGLIEGEYKITYTSTAGMTPTRTDRGGDDELDSDGGITGMDLSMTMETFVIENVTTLPEDENGSGDTGDVVGTFPDNQTDETHDQGFAFLDYGDLPDDPNDPNDYPTLMEEVGAVNVIIPGLSLGTTIDAELDGQPDAMADGEGADDDGITFLTPLVPGEFAVLNIKAVNTTGADAVLEGWIDWNGNGSLDNDEYLEWYLDPVNPSTGGVTIPYTVPSVGMLDVNVAIRVPDDATFMNGMMLARFRLNTIQVQLPFGPDKYGTDPMPGGEVEDYKLLLYAIGSYVWEDTNGNGLQDDFSSPCLNGLELNLEWAGPDGDLATTADNQTFTVSTSANNGVNGQYLFGGLTPGTYELSLATLPPGFTPTIIGAGSDEDQDSNDPEGVVIVIDENGQLLLGENGTGDQPGGLGYPDSQDNLSFDFGIVTEAFSIICNCDGSITLDWEPVANGTTWTIDVEDANGNPVVDFVNMSSTEVTFAPGTLTNGECYNFAITENLGNNQVEAILGQIYAICNPVPVLTLTGEGPTCPGGDDGSITVLFEEQGCNATYNIYLVEVGAGEQLIANAVMLNMPFVINGLSEGSYSVRVEVADRLSCAYGDGCLPTVYEEVFILENTDDEAPTKTVTDQSGNEPEMTIVYESIPEGECGVQFDWFVELDDNCPVSGLSLSAEITTSAANPSVDPSASVTLSNNGSVYVVSVHAGIGTNTLVLTATDEAGNISEMTYEITVVDNRPPEIYGPGDMQVQIPACEDGMPVNWQMSVIDDCDLDVELVQISGPQPGDVLAPGVYTVVYEATDGYGNTSQYSFDITVAQAQSPAPIVDVSGNGQFVIEDCAEDGFIVFSGHIYDCELQAGDVLDGLISISGAPLEITYILVNEGYAYFEATGNLSAGSYLIVTSYEGVTIGHAVEVVQDPDTPAVMTMPGNLAYQVPNCEGEAAVSFAVQLEDDCDEDFGTASFTVNGAPAPPFDATLSGPANGYFAWSLSLSPGMYTIVGTYTDGGGNTTEATATITVNADEDNSAPVIVYPSQNITEELDPCGPDEAEICFQATAIDDCEGDIVPTVTVTGPGGAAVPVTADGTTYCFTAGPGQYTVSIGAVDAAGNSTSEAFGVSVTQDDAPEANLACNDDINVTLDENCSRVITADMVLEGNFGCLQEDDFAITIVNDDNPANGNILDGHGQWIYEITGPDVAGFEPCWGYITGEDKTAPVVECPDNTAVATISEPVQKIQGALETTDAQLELADYSCFLDGAGPVAGGQYYDIIEFQVSADDIYTIYLNTSWGDGFTALYQGSFDADSPCENILYAADDNILGNAGPIGGLFDPQVRVTLPLRAYETYFVLVSSFGSDVTGSYEHTIFSDGNGLVGAWNFTETMLPDWTIQYDTTFSALPSTTEQLSIPLFCDDFGQIYGGDAGSVAQETAFISGTYQWVGAPSATDNCDNNVDITATDSFTASGDCGDVVITRTFTAIDGQGLTDECQQQITVRKPTLDDVNFPSFTAVVECDEDFPTLANGNPAPELTGYPFIFTAFGIFDIAPNYCNIGASYEDLPTVDECEGRFKFRREWTIFDWCDPGSSLIANQLIKVGDYTAPEVSCPAGTPIAYSTSPFSCGASFEVPMPSVSDNCSNVTVYTEIVTTTEEEVINQYGLPTGQFVTDTVVVRTIQPGANRFVSSIPFGGHFFRYVAEDDCGNETELYCPFSVIDEIEPVAVCDDQLNVSIGGGNIVPGQPALARVFASDVDEGSWDNCGDVSIAIFRNNFNPVTYTCGTQNSVTGDFVDFFCCDVGVTSDITLVVTDQYGNQNSCWLSVTPEDKINPFCDAPDNVVVDCDGLPYGFDASDADQLEDLFGMATGADNCGVASVQQVASNADLECGYGSITRIFRVTDVNGLSSTNSCVQVITVNEVHNYEIKFPKDAEADCGVAEPDSVIYNELGCDLLAVTSNDEQFSASGDECYKIFRTWKVINWCQYDGESDPYIVGRDEDCNGTPGDECIWLLARPNGKIYFDEDTDESPDNNVPGINFCGTSNDYYDFDYDETGYYQYTQIIKVYDDTAPEISFTQADAFCSLDNVNCDANVTYPFSIDEDCTPDDLTIKVFLDPFLSGDLVQLTGVVSGSYPDYTITVNDLPIGSHAFEVHVLDGCGNSDLAILPFDIIDCKAPAPFCLNGIAIELMPVDEDGDNLPDPGAGMAEIWASDFVDFSTQAGDCSEPIKYSINRVGEPNNPDQTGLVLTCDDEGTLVIEIWAYDAAGNSDFCETYILVQDNMGVCGAAAPMAAGAVNTEDNEPVEDVQVSLSGQASTAMTTQNDGAYVFTNLTSGLDYTITPQRDGDYLNGVSTFDLVLISKHILGVGPLGSPYKRIAADANNSGSITTLDLIQLRKLILSIDTEFANNTSWRFVEASYVFPNPENPWQEAFPEVVNINNLPATGIHGADFIAVKIGDVSGDVVANSFSAIDERGFDGRFQLETADEALKASNEYRIPFTAPQLAAIEGFQGTLEFDAQALELVDILPGTLSEGHFGLTQAAQGRVAMSWNWASETAVPTDSELFTLVLRARTDVQLSEALGMSDAVTPREAYGNGGTFEDVALSFGQNGMASDEAYYLGQNQPNPYRGTTMIPFEVPSEQTVTITISDVAGRLIRSYEVDAAAGLNTLNVERLKLAAGVYEYTMTAGRFTATKKMVVAD